MKAALRGCEIEERGPALSTRQEQRAADGSFVSATYEGVYEVTLRFTVIGNDANGFLEHIKRAAPGTKLQEIQIAAPPSKLRQKLTGLKDGRKYIFE